MNTLDNLLHIGPFFFVVFFIGAIIGMSFISRPYWRGFFGRNDDVTKKEMKYSIIAVAVFVCYSIAYFQGIDYIRQEARKEVLQLLNNQDLEIEVGGSILKFQEKETVLRELLTLRHIDAHHSAPEKEIVFKLKSTNGESNLILKEDSDVKNEYWVFWDKYRSTTRNEIGRIQSEKIKKTVANIT
ncbi:MAG: hypothetical protein WBG71_12160 [Leeuwenhoekiella sp.]